MGLKNFIYGLEDPLEVGHIRYVGLATHEGRPKYHEWEALNADYTSHKINWILKLLSEDRTYSTVIIEEFSDDFERDLLCKAEIAYIAEYRKNGHRLTNSSPGGDGGFERSPETLEKMSIAGKLNWEDPEWRIRTTETLRKRSKDPEVIFKRSQASIAKWENPQIVKNMLARYEDSNYIRRNGSLEDQVLRVIDRINVHLKIVETDVRRCNNSLKRIELLTQRLTELQAKLKEIA